MHAADLIRAPVVEAQRRCQSADLTRYAAAGGPPQEQQVSLASILNGNVTEDVPLRGGDVLAIRQVSRMERHRSFGKSGRRSDASFVLRHPARRKVKLRAGTRGWIFHACLSLWNDIDAPGRPRNSNCKSQMQLINRLKAERVQLKSLPESDPDQKNAKLTAISQTDATLAELATQQPVGRVVIQHSERRQQVENTSSDVTLMDGDAVFIPKNANTVLVTGQVSIRRLSAHKEVARRDGILSQAGGLTPMADKKRYLLFARMAQ